MRGGGIARFLGKAFGVECFGLRIENGEILAESANHAVANGPPVRRALPGEYEAEHRSAAKGAIVPLGIDIGDERAQDRGLLGQRKTERAPMRDIRLDMPAELCGEYAHHAPPGNGRATSASCGTATFT